MGLLCCCSIFAILVNLQSYLCEKLFALIVKSSATKISLRCPFVVLART